MPRFTYRKSSYSDEKAECVEVATNLPGVVAIRDSKDPTGQPMRTLPMAWVTFNTSLVKGEFER